MEEKYTMSKNAKKTSFALIGLGLLLTLIHVIFFHDDHNTRLWSNVLLNTVWMTGIAICGTFFVAVHNIAMSAWHTVVKRVAEVFWYILPVTFFVLLLTFLVHPELYHWTEHGIAEVNSDGTVGEHFDELIISGANCSLNCRRASFSICLRASRAAFV